jgi:dTDP-4-dehydrorhamnose 3,5-epimerase
MEQGKIEGVILTLLKNIFHPSGNILHAMKATDPGYKGFGEAYFSTVNYQAIKGWKKHKIMTLNLVVPVGKIRFVIYDDRNESPTKGIFEEIVLSPENYQRLTIPPHVWLGFQGLEKELNLLLNIGDITHDPLEAENLEINTFKYDW